VSEGATISTGQEILEIETSKIANVWESPVAGVLRRRVTAEGETVPVGALLGVVADAVVPDAEIDAFVARYKETQAAEAAAAAPPPEPHTVVIDGRPFRYLRMGEGEATPIVLIHGFGGDLTNWQFNQPALAERREVIAIDLPGHGGSTKQLAGADVPSLGRDVAALISELGITKAHLVGHSLGGAIALWLALEQPARVASATLISSAGLGPEINIAYITGFIGADKRKDMKATVEALFADPALVSRDMVEDLLRYKRLDGVLPALRAIAEGVFPGGTQGLVLADRLAAAGVPVQTIWGEGDQIIPASHAEIAPTGRRAVIAGAGHMVHIERPAEVNWLIEAIIAG
jgi:pyruvate dehydrogenase E2 component (dihydrolipoamide acetyltransferase)